MTKRILLGLAFLSLGYASVGQNEFVVRVAVQGLGNKKLFLVYTANNKSDTIFNYTKKDDEIIYRGKVEEPTIATLNFEYKVPSAPAKGKVNFVPPGLSFILTNDAITIDGRADKIYAATVKGGKSNDEWSPERVQLAILAERRIGLLKQINALNKNDNSGRLMVEKNLKSIAEEEEKIKNKFIEEHPNAFASIYFLRSFSWRIPVADIEAKYEKLGPGYKGTALAKPIEALIERNKKDKAAAEIGSQGADFSKRDINGKEVSLSGFRGQYILLDFWGSWCKPCRATHPHLKEIYNRYKSKDFEIVGISEEKIGTFENKEQSWKTAIEHDGLTWVQILNERDKDKYDVVKSYAVIGFPTKILLDKDGKQLLRLVGDSPENIEALDNKLKELLDK